MNTTQTKAFKGEIRQGTFKLEFELEEGQHGFCFSMYGEKRKEYYGQCCDDVLKDGLSHLPDAVRLVEIWRDWHLNNLNAGFPVQHKALEGETLSRSDWFGDACKVLKEKGLYEIPLPEHAKCTGSFPGEVLDGTRGYRFGERWVFREMPGRLVKEIKGLIERNPVK